MKIRTGFVSNSSSSSFICDVCNKVNAGYDVSHEDFKMVYCVNEHLMCQKHVVKFKTLRNSIDTPEKLKAYIEKNWTDKVSMIYIEKALIKISCIKDDFEYVRDDILDQEMGIVGLFQDDCPVCNLTEINSNSVIDYICKSRNIVIDDIKKEIKDNFKTLKDLQLYLGVTKDNG